MKTMSKRAWVLYVFIAAFLAGLIVLFYILHERRFVGYEKGEQAPVFIRYAVGCGQH